MDSPGTVRQPEPTGTGEDVTELVIKDLTSRRIEGTQKYGRALHTYNGRQALVDAYQECMDMCLYLRQHIAEDFPLTDKVADAANERKQFTELRELLVASQEKTGFIHYGSLTSMLQTVIDQRDRIAADALSGANSVRDDMVSYLRSVVFVMESVVGDHLNHSQKNERIRGVMGVLERHIHSLREEKFNFRDGVWRRGRDLFQWNENERRLREKVRELEAQLKQKSAESVSEQEREEQPF